MRRRQQLKVPDAVMEESLDLLRRSFAELLQHGTDGLTFEELYRTSYSLVIHGWSAQLYDLVKQLITLRGKEIGRMIARLTPGDTLDSVVAACETFSLRVSLIKDCVCYMERTFVFAEGLANVKVLGKSIFDEEVTEQILESRILESWRQRIVAQLLDEVPISDDVKETASMMLRLYAFAPTHYETVFEMPLRRAAVNFYHEKAVKFLNENGTEGFDEIVNAWLRIEGDRAQMCSFEKNRDDYLNAISDMLSLSGENFQRPAL